MYEERIHSCTRSGKAGGVMEPGAKRVVQWSRLPQSHGHPFLSKNETS